MNKTLTVYWKDTILRWIILDEQGFVRADFLPDCPWVNAVFPNLNKANGILNVYKFPIAKKIGEINREGVITK